MEMWNLILPNFALTMWIIRILWFRIKFDYKLPPFDRSNRFMEWPKRLENDKKLLIHEKRIKFDIFLKCNKSITKYWKLRKFSYQHKYFSPKKNFMHLIPPFTMSNINLWLFSPLNMSKPTSHLQQLSRTGSEKNSFKLSTWSKLYHNSTLNVV